MSSRRLTALIDLTRPVNCFITFLSIAAASIIAGGGPEAWLEILIAACVGAFVAGGANAINDYFDVEIDRVNKPDRPIPRGALERDDARLAWFSLSLIALGLNFFLDAAALGIASFAIATLFFYSYVLKKTVLIGNLVVALMTGMALVYGAVVVGKPERSLVPALFAFLINLARELVKDVEDMEGDAKQRAVTLPVKYGVRSALAFATGVLIVLIVTTIGAYVLKAYTSTYLYIVVVVDVLLVYVLVSMWKNSSPVNLNRLSQVLKVNMAIGLAAIFAGS